VAVTPTSALPVRLGRAPAQLERSVSHALWGPTALREANALRVNLALSPMQINRVANPVLGMLVPSPPTDPRALPVLIDRVRLLIEPPVCANPVHTTTKRLER
jgi:hypothetical protein